VGVPQRGGSTRHDVAYLLRDVDLGELIAGRHRESAATGVLGRCRRPRMRRRGAVAWLAAGTNRGSRGCGICARAWADWVLRVGATEVEEAYLGLAVCWARYVRHSLG
jgi:hypothetical protein